MKGCRVSLSRVFHGRMKPHALAGTSVYLAAGAIDPILAAPVILGVLAGAFVGTRVLVRLTNQTVRRFFLVVLAILGIEMIVRGLRGG